MISQKSPLTITLSIILLTLTWMISPDTPAQTNNPLTNSDIIRMVKKGLGDNVIVGVISSSEVRFDLSVNTIIRLHDAGVSDKIIEAMQKAQSNSGMRRTTTNATPAATVSNLSSRPPTPSLPLKTGSESGNTSQSFTFKVRRCGALESGVGCDFSVLNNGAGRKLVLILSSSKMVDDNGRVRVATKIRFGGASKVTRDGEIGFQGMIAAGETKLGRVYFDKDSLLSRRVASIELGGMVYDYQVRVLFHEIPLESISADPPAQTVDSYELSEQSSHSRAVLPYQHSEVAFNIYGVNQWVDTGIDVEAGTRLVFSADGTITMSNSHPISPDPTGADALRNQVFRNSKVLERSYGTKDLRAKFVSRLGRETAPVKLGIRVEVIVRPGQDGRLWLGIPTSYAGDISGRLNVLIQW